MRRLDRLFFHHTLICMCMRRWAGPMRTTVEIDDSLRAPLLQKAAQRGLNGFSSIVREALEVYFEIDERRQESARRAMTMMGTLGDEEADALEFL